MRRRLKKKQAKRNLRLYEDKFERLWNQANATAWVASDPDGNHIVEYGYKSMNPADIVWLDQYEEIIFRSQKYLYEIKNNFREV